MDEDTAKVARALRRTIEDAGLTLRGVEERMEMGEDYLSQLLRGAVDLKLKHIFALLRSVGVAPDAFFAATFPQAPAPGNHLLFESSQRLIQGSAVAYLTERLRQKGLLDEAEAQEAIRLISGD